MSLAARLRNTYLRIDARSLGLFRVAMGLALIGDWWTRWADARAFYSNDGVLANHAHLHALFKQEGTSRVWSVFHAFSSPGENRVALLLTLLAYLFFLFGLHTRVFHVLSLVLLVSLTGRNVLLEGPQNHVAILVLAATAFLPLGSRFSVDSLRASFRRHDEKEAAALNDRAPPAGAVLAAERAPGWSPTSLAALAVLLHLSLILFAVWRQQSGPAWQNGTALHYVALGRALGERPRRARPLRAAGAPVRVDSPPPPLHPRCQRSCSSRSGRVRATPSRQPSSSSTA